MYNNVSWFEKISFSLLNGRIKDEKTLSFKNGKLE